MPTTAIRPTILFSSAFAVCLGLCLLAPAAAQGDGFRLIDHGTAAAGQAAAFAAQADDPSALYYNPAGMTQLPGLQAYFGTNFVSVSTRFTNTAGETVHGGTGGVANPPPSHGYLTYSLKGLGIPVVEDLTIGIGVTSPFGLHMSYPTTGPLSTISTYAALPLLDIKPTAAYRLTPYLSIGAGLDIYTFSGLVGDGQAELKRLAGPEFAPLGIPSGAVLEINGTDTAVGFSLGALITPLRIDGKPRVNLGIVFRSPVTLNLKGDFLVNETRAAGAKVQLNLPWVLTGAVAGWLVRDHAREWKIEVDVDYAHWSSFKDLDVKLSNGVTLPFPQKWGPTYVVMLGTEYKWLALSSLPGWEIAARGGYLHSETPQPSKTFAASLPDADYNVFAVGLGLLCRAPGRLLAVLPCGSGGGWWAPNAIGVDLSYQAFLYDSRQISDNIDPRLNGRWKTIDHVGSISFRASF